MELAPTAENDSVFFISLYFKGESYDVPVQVGDAVSTIFDFAQEALHFPRETCRLIHRGKQLQPDTIIGTEKMSLAPGSKVMLVASSARDIAYVKNSRADPLVKGFAEEERDERNRRKRALAASMSAWGTKQDSEYRFNSIKAEFKYHTPTPYDAERLLEKLATDPGIIEIMKTRQFKVGILTEMSPVEAQERMAKEGTPNMDLLGYNQNSGEKIVLRLRTDTLKGFRPYQDIMNTLIHELTHNVWGPHDHNFWKLFGELKAQYMRFHKFWSHGGRTADSSVSGQFGGFAGEMDEESAEAPGFGQMLGSAVGSEDGSAASATPLSIAERRARAIDSLEKRTRTSLAFVCGCGLDHSTMLECRPIVPDAPTGGSSQVEEVCESQGPAADDVQVARAESSAGASASVASSDANDGVGHLGGEDSREVKLVGTDVWVEQFSTQLQTLRTSDGAVQLLLRLVKNVVHNPSDLKFRSIRANNPKIKSTLLSAGEVAERLLISLGFHIAMEGGEKTYVLRDDAMDCTRLHLGKDLLEQQLLVDPVC